MMRMRIGDRMISLDIIAERPQSQRPTLKNTMDLTPTLTVKPNASTPSGRRPVVNNSGPRGTNAHRGREQSYVMLGICPIRT